MGFENHDFSEEISRENPGTANQTTHAPHVCDRLPGKRWVNPGHVFGAKPPVFRRQEEMDLCRRTLEEKSRAEEQAQKERRSKRKVSAEMISGFQKKDPLKRGYVSFRGQKWIIMNHHGYKKTL